MSFTPKIWNDNDILSILDLNRLEEAVAEMGNYTPTVWAAGDKITAEKMNKLEQGVAESGETWNTVFEGNVTTVADEAVGYGDPYATLNGVQDIGADTIKVTFNGTVYECEKKSAKGDYYGADIMTGSHDFSEYPFTITDGGLGSWVIYTQTAGTYSLKIEEPQSGGSSDFSKAILVNTEELEPNVAYRADKTVAEISQAMNEGKMVFVNMGNNTYIVTNCNTVLKRIGASVVTFNTTSMETTCAVSANASVTAQFSSTDDYPVFVQQSQ